MATRNSERPDYAPMRQSLEKKFDSLTSQLESLRADIRAGSESSRGSFAEVEDRAAETSSLEDTLAQEERLVDELAQVNIALKKLRRVLTGNAKDAVVRLKSSAEGGADCQILL